MATRRKFPRPCVVCGELSFESRCEAHTVRKPGGSPHLRGSSYSRRKLRRQTLERDFFTCQSCGLVDPSGRKLQADHMLALSRGGSSELSNMQTLCGDCHSVKSSSEQGTNRT